MKALAKIIGTSLGAGYAPLAPGTFGSAMGILLMVLIFYLFPNLYPTTLGSSFVFFGILVLITLIGVWASSELEKEWPHDDNRIVIDEVAGQCLTLMAIPFSWWNLLAGFILFRLFDIYKPAGIRKLDKLGGSWSVMLDDILAGLYANITLQLILRFF